MSMIKQCTIRFNMDNPNEQKIYDYMLAKTKEKNVSQNHFIMRLLESEMNDGGNTVIDTSNLIQQIVNGVVADLIDKGVSLNPMTVDNMISVKDENENQLNEDAMDFLSIFY